MVIWLVSPAWRRYDVTRLALAQRTWLADRLGAAGHECHTVIVADDDNLDIARENGCATVEMDNACGLGRRFNAGYEYAAAQGADYIVHIGSDDWLHPDAFATVTVRGGRPRPIIAGRRLAVVDLHTGGMLHLTLTKSRGVIPWIIPREVLEATRFAPITPSRARGIDGDLARHLVGGWQMHDPGPVARVDFKSDVNLNSYRALREIAREHGHSRDHDGDTWDALAAAYPRRLVDLARDTHAAYSRP